MWRWTRFHILITNGCMVIFRPSMRGPMGAKSLPQLRYLLSSFYLEKVWTYLGYFFLHCGGCLGEGSLVELTHIVKFLALQLLVLIR